MRSSLYYFPWRCSFSACSSSLSCFCSLESFCFSLESQSKHGPVGISGPEAQCHGATPPSANPPSQSVSTSAHIKLYRLLQFVPTTPLLVESRGPASISALCLQLLVAVGSARTLFCSYQVRLTASPVSLGGHTVLRSVVQSWVQTLCVPKRQML